MGMRSRPAQSLWPCQMHRPVVPVARDETAAEVKVTQHFAEAGEQSHV